MLNHSSFITNLILSVLIFSLILSFTTVVALAYFDKNDVYDQWNTIQEFEESSSLMKFLKDMDWVWENVDLVDLDYILVLTQQCSSEFFPNLSASLVLSVISVESSFNKNLCGFNNDTGLMQVIPRYHKERIEKYIYDENVDLYDPRLNIMVGMDYLNELMIWSNGQVELALMAYNSGQKKALDLYSNGIVSSYAEDVINRMVSIDLFFKRRDYFVIDNHR